MSEFLPSFTLYRDGGARGAVGVTMTIQEYGDVDFYDEETEHIVTMSAEQFEMFKELQARFSPKEGGTVWDSENPNRNS